MRFLNYLALVDPLLKDLRKTLVEFAQIKKGEKILDLCCGSGDQVFFYAQKGALAFGVDKNFQMLELAKKDKRMKELKSSVYFLNLKAESLSFKEDYFDKASISLAFHEMDKKTQDKVIFEMRRVTKKEGILIFADFNPKLSLPLKFFLGLIEYFGGRENYRNFRDYIKNGGLEGILKRNYLAFEEKIYLKRKMILALKAKNIK